MLDYINVFWFLFCQMYTPCSALTPSKQYLSIFIDILSFLLQLLIELKQVKFEFQNQLYSFDNNSEFTNGYDLIMWKKDGNQRTFKKTGRYHIANNQMELDVKESTWLLTANTSVR